MPLFILCCQKKVGRNCSPSDARKYLCWSALQRNFPGLSHSFISKPEKMNALQQNIWGMYSSVFTTMFRNMSPKNINKNTNFTKLQTLLSSSLIEITILTEYKASMSVVKWTNNKLSESCGQDESGIKVPCPHPQSYCCIHVEKPHVPMGAICETQQPLGKPRQLLGIQACKLLFASFVRRL